MSIKMKKVKKFESFLDAVKGCSGNVYLRTDLGDVYNLMSDFSRYVALPALLGYRGDELTIECDCENDELMIVECLPNCC